MDNLIDRLADSLKIALRKMYGTMIYDDDNFDAVMADTNFLPDYRFYCVHCGGAGNKRDKIKHDDACWYHNAKMVLNDYKNIKRGKS